MTDSDQPSRQTARTGLRGLAAGLLPRCAAGGVLMGLANLVPGVSGGTMLLAAGIYREFVGAIAALSRLRIGLQPLLVLATVAGFALLAILAGAGTLKDLVVHHRWIMYALFVGLTLGGVPLVWRPVRTRSVGYWIAAAAGVAAMVALFLLQRGDVTAGSQGSSFVGLATAGAAGASAMILPGLSGGYLLLLLGQYVTILSGLDRLKESLLRRDLDAVVAVGLEVVLPVGVGLVVGVVLVSNLVQWLFRRFERATYGFLLGLLLGAVIGLWPFQRPVEPVAGETVIRGELVTEENLASFAVEDYATAVYRPSPSQVAVAILLVAVGIGSTVGVGHLGRASGSAQSAASTVGENSL